MYSDEVNADIEEISEFWSQFNSITVNGTTSNNFFGDAVQVMNDNYLKFNGLSDGVKSYGRMVDLLIAYIYPKI